MCSKSLKGSTNRVSLIDAEEHLKDRNDYGKNENSVRKA